MRGFLVAVSLLALAAASPGLAQFSPIPSLPGPAIIVPPAAPQTRTCCRDECLPDASCRRGAVCPPICVKKCSSCE